MKIEEALKLKVGDVVYFPPDRGDPGGYSTVKFIGANQEIKKNIYGVEYIWVTLVRGVWPTNRLG